MHHTICFAEANQVTTEAFIAGVPDQSARVSSDDIYIGDYNKIVGAFAVHPSCQYAKLESPSLRRFFNPFINPKVSLAGDSSDPIQGMDLSRNPISLATNEALNAKMKTSGAEATNRMLVGVNLAKAALAPVFGEIFTLRISQVATLTIGVWTNHTLTLGVDLPVGRYAVVGVEVWANYAGAFRLVPVGTDFRPGGIMVSDEAPDGHHPQSKNQRHGNWGVWCEFNQLTPPTMDICPYKAGTWFNTYLDLMKIG